MWTVSRDNTNRLPAPAAVLTLLKPHTWFPPMWAFMCGAVSSGQSFADQWILVVLGIILAGPIVCGMSQAANDWCDRHVDAINEPHRPIPSGRIPGKWGQTIAHLMSVLALIVAWPLGIWVFIATIFALAAAWAYSAEPLRMKKSGWLGPGLVALCYEGLPWFTGAAALAGAFPSTETLIIAAFYAAGAHGIMTLNDFKAQEGDRATGVASLPVVMGPIRAAWLACLVMGSAQVGVIAYLAFLGATTSALIVTALLVAQIWAMRRLIADPEGRATWYNQIGVLLYVSGMMVSAFAIRSLEVMS